jgi:AcrR family transcriptional regulator
MGLRERKRIATVRRIQEAALDLFDAHGFDRVTIEEIAAAADVSPSTIFRYFGTKEQVVLYDEFDLQLLETVTSELRSHPPVEAVRRSISAIMGEFFGRDEDLARRKVRYWLEEPALQAAAAQQTLAFEGMVADALAGAAGRRTDELEVQVIAAALIWSLLAAARHWYAGGFATPLEDELQRALAVVEGGLRLDPGPKPAP